jgi:hypothetical protein
MTRVFVPLGIEVTPRRDRWARRAVLNDYVLDGDVFVPSEGAQAVGWLVDPATGCETLQSFRERLLGFPRTIVQVSTETGWVAHAEAIVEIR